MIGQPKVRWLLVMVKSQWRDVLFLSAISGLKSTIRSIRKGIFLLQSVPHIIKRYIITRLGNLTTSKTHYKVFMTNWQSNWGDETGNNGNVGIRDFTTWKQRKNQQNITPVSIEPGTSVIQIWELTVLVELKNLCTVMLDVPWF